MENTKTATTTKPKLSYTFLESISKEFDKDFKGSLPPLDFSKPNAYEIGMANLVKESNHRQQLYGAYFAVGRLLGAVDDQEWDKFLKGEAK